MVTTAPSRQSATPTNRRRKAMRARRWLPSPAILRVVVVIVAILGLEVLTRLEAISSLILSPPSEILLGMVDVLPTAQFGSDLARTGLTVAMSSAAGCVIGVLLGTFGWRLPFVWKVLEPYLIALYAMPIVVFYPILMVVFGITIWPPVLIATFAAVVPAAVSTCIALRAVPQALLNLGRSLNCSRLRMTRSIIVPSALPLAIPGVRLSCIYAVIATIAMEFIQSDSGLGFRAGEAYRQFRVTDMWSMIVVVAVLAMAVSWALSRAERRVRRDTVTS
ncbi:ABC transporter permease [Actinophytocola sp.]|uniref:ABC transporter permease n=1 Tax=Actinophytocola sp. TaxID=1872138 RepID=UPI003D6C00CA